MLHDHVLVEKVACILVIVDTDRDAVTVRIKFTEDRHDGLQQGIGAGAGVGCDSVGIELTDVHGVIPLDESGRPLQYVKFKAFDINFDQTDIADIFISA